VLNQATIDKMVEMKMLSLAEEFRRQIASAEFSSLSFEERVGMMIDAECASRDQRKLRRRLGCARLRHQASPEDGDWRASR